MSNSLNKTIEPFEKGNQANKPLEITYCLEDFEDAVDFLSNLKHEENSPWAFLGDNAIKVLQKLTLVRSYLINPSDQQKIGIHTLSEVFMFSFPKGLKIGEKKITSSTALDQAIIDLCDMLGYPYPAAEIKPKIMAIINCSDDPTAVIDHKDKF